MGKLIWTDSLSRGIVYSNCNNKTIINGSGSGNTTTTTTTTTTTSTTTTTTTDNDVIVWEEQ